MDGAWTGIRGDDVEEAVTRILAGMDAVVEYRRERGIIDSSLRGGYEGLDGIHPAEKAVDEWQGDREHLHIHDARYTPTRINGLPGCTITVQASAADDVEDGERVDDPYGIRGEIRVRGVFPDDVDPDRYVEQVLGA